VKKEGALPTTNHADHTEGVSIGGADGSFWLSPSELRFVAAAVTECGVGGRGAKCGSEEMWGARFREDPTRVEDG
jgi:hypothetical protein